MTATPDNAAPDPQRIIAELQRKLDESRAELAARNSAYSERIAYQGAANDVLKVMSASPGDPQPVFDLISVRARDICDAYGVTVCEFDGSLLHWRAATGISEDPAVREAFKAAFPTPPTHDMAAGRAILTRAIVHMRDHETEPGLRRFSLSVKSSVVVPLMRGGLPIGTLQMGSRERGGFSDTQVELLKTFAEQAVIAISSAETYRALQTRTTDLRESLQVQTATSDVLKIISSSLGELEPVFRALLENAVHLCEAEFGMLFLFKENEFRAVGKWNLPLAYSEFLRKNTIGFDPRTPVGRAAITKQPVQVADILVDQSYIVRHPGIVAVAEDGGARTLLQVPMLKESELVGTIGIYRQEVRPFSDKQIALVQSFAAQAVIAIENARLLNELRARTDDLGESLQQQTATADVLEVISRSAFDLNPVFETVAESSVRLCGSDRALIFRFDGELLRVAAAFNAPDRLMDWLERNPIRPGRYSVGARAALERQTIHVQDVLADTEHTYGAKDVEPFRTVLGVPMLKGDELLGVIMVYHNEVRPFTDKQIALIQTFADQAVIAISNVGLFEQVQQRTRELSASLDDLRAAQDRLVQTEKLASLGQLTAGIAHEIKNPLNFVNNFSALSAELIDELDETLAPAPLDRRMRGDVGELTQMLKSNLEKVVQHGKRADSIVKNMLLHSREGSGERRSADINALVEESLNLAYHGARAEKPGFNITLTRDLDPDAGSVDLYPQEMTRALLNLISNGFYAATQRKSADGESFVPILIATTKNLGKTVEIRIRDNGAGIPEGVKEKIFNPFFTTKPSGEGTGLGLSMSHDIIVKQHGGSIDVETEPGLFTEFKIVLPRTSKR
jgi:two-component system, NtrC family, sensor kinase